MSTTTDSYDLNETLERLAAIEKEATDEVGFASNAYPYFWVAQETGDYWKNKVDGIEYEEPDTEEFDNVTVTFTIRFIAGSRTSDYPGDVEKRLYRLIALFPAVLNEREGLQSDAFEETQTHLEYVYMRSCSGYAEFADNGGGANLQIGTEFTVEAHYRIRKTQQYTS